MNLVLQILEITPRVILCVNLVDEAKKKHIRVHLDRLTGQSLCTGCQDCGPQRGRTESSDHRRRVMGSAV